MDTTIDNYAYYQDEYRAGLTTDLPTEHQLESMARESFRGSPLDLSQKIQILKALRPSGVVLDYGCSWGYGVYQLLAHGYRALGFEISKPRATLGREKLGVEILDEPRDLYGLPEKSFDIVFTNHVLEHIPAVGEVFNLFARLLSEDGLVFCILPNFTGKLARSGMFWNWIGEAHPIAPTWDFFERNLPKHGFRRVVCGSGPFDDKLAELILKGAWDQLDTEGDELLVVAWR